MTTTKRKTTTSDLPNAADKQNLSIYNSKPSLFSEKPTDAAAFDNNSFHKKHSSNTNFNHGSRNSKNNLFLAITNRIYSLVKYAIADSNTAIFGLVIAVLVLVLIFTDTPVFSSEKPVVLTVPGLTQKLSTVDTPFIVPDVINKYRKNSVASKHKVPKKAPGDFGTGISEKPRPAAAAAAAGDIEVAAAAALDLQDSNSVVYIDNPEKTPPLIIVTAIDPTKYKPEYIQIIIENRRKYAARHGYGLYIRYVSDFYEWKFSHDKSPSWAKLAALRAALHAFPHAQHFWYLDQHGLIANLTINVIDSVIQADSLNSLMLRDEPVIQFSPVHTYKNNIASQVKFIVTQDPVDGLSPASFIIANTHLDKGQYAHSLLDYWNDPLTLSYPSFENYDASALNHIMKWHPVYLSRTALVPIRTLAGYRLLISSLTDKITPEEAQKSLYQPGDFVVFFDACQPGSLSYCMKAVAELLNTQESSAA